MLVRCSRYASMLRSPASRVFVNVVRNYMPTAALLGRNTTWSHIPSLNNADPNSKEIYLVGKSQGEVEKDLVKLGFETLDSSKLSKNNDDFFLNYLNHLNSGFKKSNKNFKKLQKFFKENSQLPSNAKFPILFNYILEESELEIRRLKKFTPEEIIEQKSQQSQELLQNCANSKNPLEDIIINNTIYDTDKRDQSDIYLANVNFLLKILSDFQNDPNWQDKGVTMEQLVGAFELSKLIPFSLQREQGIFFSAKLLYSLKKVRMDPVNESFYLNSLVSFGQYKEAYKLFSTYKDKVAQKWWNELGLFILLNGNNLRGFSRLLSETDKSFSDSFPNLRTKVIKLAIKKFLHIDDTTNANNLTDRFIKIIETNRGLAPVKVNKDLALQMFQSEDEANDFLNKVEVPIQNDFITVLNYYIQKKNLKMVALLFQKYLELPNKNQDYRDVILRTNLNLLKDFTSLKALVEENSISDLGKENFAILESNFRDIISKYNIADTDIRNMLFKNFNELLSNRELAGIMSNIINIKGNLTEPKSKKEVARSENYKTLIKTLLSSSKQQTALAILKRMEESYVKSQEDRNLMGMQPYPEVNSHHYSAFINYYHLRTIQNGRRLTKLHDKKVEDILDRMNQLGIIFNANFFTKLLRYYRGTDNLNRCFFIIKFLFNEVENNRKEQLLGSKMFQSSDISQQLYLEIWKVYYNYYSNMNRSTIGSRSGVKTKLWKRYFKNKNEEIETIPLQNLMSIFKIMIENENILPDPNLYKTIVKTFIKSRNWYLLPSVLQMMTEVHSLQIDDELFKYIHKGIKTEFLKLEEDKEWKLNSEANPQTVHRYAIELLKNKQKERIFFDNEEIVNLMSQTNKINKDVTRDILIDQILVLVKHENPYDINFNKVLEGYEQLQINPEHITALVEHVNTRVNKY